MTHKTSTNFSTWKAFQPGDIIDLVAPASGCSPVDLKYIEDFLCKWQLKPRIAKNIFGDDLLCANSDEQRFEGLITALNASDSKAVMCIRGGYGSMRLLPMLNSIEQPKQAKLFIGMSDITALQLYLMQHWHWPALHAGYSTRVGTDPSNLEELQNIILGKKDVMHYELKPMNTIKRDQAINTTVTGGNLCLVQASIGTSWQIDTKNKILFLEEVNERGYRVDRMLQHLIQAGALAGVTAIIFGDFIGGDEPDGSNLVQAVLQRFAQSCNFPVYSYPGIGHGAFNRPLPLGTHANLNLNTHNLSVATGIS